MKKKDSNYYKGLKYKVCVSETAGTYHLSIKELGLNESGEDLQKTYARILAGKDRHIQEMFDRDEGDCITLPEDHARLLAGARTDWKKYFIKAAVVGIIALAVFDAGVKLSRKLEALTDNSETKSLLSEERSHAQALKLHKKIVNLKPVIEELGYFYSGEAGKQDRAILRESDFAEINGRIAAIRGKIAAAKDPGELQRLKNELKSLSWLVSEVSKSLSSAIKTGNRAEINYYSSQLLKIANRARSERAAVVPQDKAVVSGLESLIANLEKGD